MLLIELFVAFALAAAMSAAFSLLVIRAALWDTPNHVRKAHAAPTPTSGGVAAMIGFGGALLALTLWPEAMWIELLGEEPIRQVALATLASLVALGLGLWDDYEALGPRLKFGLMSGLSLFIAIFVARAETLPLAGPVVLHLGLALGVLGSALWVFTLANAVNFIDGANGLSMGCMSIGLFVLGVLGLAHGAPHAALLGLAGSGACLGVLLWNFPSGRVFAGDAGALFAGFLAAATGLILVQEGEVSPLVPPLVFFPILADVLLTLAYRAGKKRQLMDGHREHLFQIGTRSGLAHWQISLIYWGATLHCAVIAFAVSFGPKLAPPTLFRDPPQVASETQQALLALGSWVASAGPFLTLIILALLAVRISVKVRRFALARGLAD